jgi:hypothetical protein
MAAVGDGLQFSSARDSALGDDLLTGTVNAPAGRLDARFMSVEPEAAELALTVTWQRLVEYRDADGDGRFGLADPELQRIAIAQLPATTTVTPLLGGGQSATVTYTLPINESDPSPLPGVPRQHGSLRLTFALVPRSASVASAALDPTDLGLGVEVRDFPYGAADTRLALVSEVATLAPRLDREAAGVSLASGGVTLGLRWDETALADGARQSATVTTVSGRADQVTVIQSMPRGDRVEQDGGMTAQRWTAGVVEAIRDLPLGDWRFYTLGLAAVAVGLGVPSLRRLRER